jgi:glycosyltransferase involved in cell wall biosynthesis
MTILFITNHLNIGGITSYVFSLAYGLKKRGHNIYIASSGGTLLPKFLEEDIVYIPIPIDTKQEVGPKLAFSLFKLLGQIKPHKIELTHSNSRTTQVLGSLLQSLSKVPHVTTCHGFFRKRPFRKLFPCWGKKTIAISKQVKEHLVKDFKVKAQNIYVIHNGIDLKMFESKNPDARKQIRKKLGLEGDALVVGIVARLSDVKGHAYLIQAMKPVLDKIPRAKLLIVGEGKTKSDLEGLTARLAIEKSVFFIPEVPDTRDVLSAMDIFAMPSLNEGLGLALMEAMASGLAVIGSDVGGIRTLIKDNYNGLLVKPADSQALSLAILDLLQDQSKREYLGRQAKESIAQNFSQEKMVFETERVYSECLNTKSY